MEISLGGRLMNKRRDDPRDCQPATEPSLRDRNGRFIGCGNPRGRPRKRKAEQPQDVQSISFGAALVQGLAKPVSVRGPAGPVEMSAAEVIVQKLLNDAMTGSSADRARALRIMVSLGGFDLAAEIEVQFAAMIEAQNAEPPWTAELESDYRRIIGEDPLEDSIEPETEASQSAAVGRPSRRPSSIR